MKDRGVVCAFSIFKVGGSVWVCVCVYTRTHIHCIDGEPRSRVDTRGGPDESRWTKFWRTYIHICVQSTLVYVYAKRWDEILDKLLVFLNIFILPEKKKKCVHNLPIISNLNS